MNNYKQENKRANEISSQFLWYAFILSLLLISSCTSQPDHVDWDCGEVETEITALDYRIGSYTASGWSNEYSTDFELATIGLFIKDFMIITETERSCASYNPLPQHIEKIMITSSESVSSGGIEYLQGDDISELFSLLSSGQLYSVSDFIVAQNEDPLLFYEDGQEKYFRLLARPDAYINQPITILLTFDNTKTLGVEIPKFEVSD